MRELHPQETVERVETGAETAEKTGTETTERTEIVRAGGLALEVTVTLGLREGRRSLRWRCQQQRTGVMRRSRSWDPTRPRQRVFTRTWRMSWPTLTNSSCPRKLRTRLD